MENTIHLLCILAPLIFLVDLGLRMAQGQGTPAQRWKTLWTEEHWLVCDHFAQWRQRLAAPLFLGLIVIWWIWGVVENVLEVFFLPQVLAAVTVVKSLTVSALILTKILCCTRYSYRQLLCAAAAFALFAKAYSVCGYVRVIQAMFLLLAAKDTKLVQNMQAMLAGTLISFIARVGLSLAGYLDTMATNENGRVRFALGYGSYNSLGIAVAEMMLLYFLLRYQKLRWWDWAVLAVGAAFIQFVPNSRGSLVLCLLVFLMAMMAKCLPKLAAKKWAAWVATCLAVVPLVASYIILLLHGFFQGTKLAQILERLFTGRARLAWSHIYTRGMPGLFGEPFTTQRGDLYTVDNAFVYYLYALGPIVAAMLMIGAVWLVFRLARRGGADWGLAALVLGYLFYGVMERQFYPNLFTMLLCNVIYADSCSLTLHTQTKPLSHKPGSKGVTS